MAKRDATLRVPHDWQSDFKAATFRTSFTLSLTQSMIELLCAIADGVHWDRAIFFGNIHRPDNWWASATSLMKRGLIRNATDDEKKAMRGHPSHRKEEADAYHEWTNWALTPVGEKIVEMFKLAGIFIESDAAIVKRMRKA